MSPIRLFACHGNIFVLQFIFIFPSFPVIYSKRHAGFPLRLNPAKNLFYDFFFTCFKNQPLFATFSYFLPLSFSLLQTAPSPFSVTFLMRHPLTYKRTLFSRQYTVSEKISPNFYKFFCRVFFCVHRHSHFSAHKHYLILMITPSLIKGHFFAVSTWFRQKFHKNFFFTYNFCFNILLQKHKLFAYREQ